MYYDIYVFFSLPRSPDMPLHAERTRRLRLCLVKPLLTLHVPAGSSLSLPRQARQVQPAARWAAAHPGRRGARRDARLWPGAHRPEPTNLTCVVFVFRAGSSSLATLPIPRRVHALFFRRSALEARLVLLAETHHSHPYNTPHRPSPAGRQLCAGELPGSGPGAGGRQGRLRRSAGRVHGRAPRRRARAVRDRPQGGYPCCQLYERRPWPF